MDRQFSLLDIYKLILQGDMGRFPYGIWKEDSIKKECVDVIRYFVENILQCDQEEIPQKATFSQFRKYRLYGMIKNVFNQSTYEAIDAAYPGRFKRWEFGNYSRHNWTKDSAANAVKWLIQEKLGWSFDKAENRLTTQDFHNYGLGYILEHYYELDVKQAVQDAKPHRGKLLRR
ncbi:MAG: hypothetical protein AVO34_06805 [Firmicutes bacterium ML8_F2]|nr:MAG: hypothetical protein AVO34_06805 [Firmicutes bacterium ML8_F2]